MYRLLVPLDGSNFAEQALNVAARLSAPDKLQLKLLHVVDFVHALPPSDDDEDDWLERTAQSDAAAYLEHVAKELKTRFCLSAETAVVVGSPREQIQHEAQAWIADLIVMATHGRGAFDRAWLGSVADTLVRESTTPVLLIRPAEHQPAESARLRHILVPLDGSPLAEQIIAPAARLARLSGARMTLLNAVRPWVMATRPMAYAPHLEELRERAVSNRQSEAHAYLAQQAATLSAQLGEVGTAVIVCESSEANEIMRYAEDNGADLIALATRGRTGLRRLVLGSVADKLIRGASVPVLVKCPE